MWIKSKDKIIDEFNKQERKCETKKMKDTKYPEVDKALFEWFRDLRDRSIKVNGPIMQAKAEDFAKMFGYKEFFCRSG